MMKSVNQKPVAIVMTQREFDEIRGDYVVYISHGIDLITDEIFVMQQDPVNLHPDIVFSPDFNEYVLMEKEHA